MMRWVILFIMLCISGCGIGKNEEKIANELFIKKVNHFNWREGVPLDSLEQAGKLCKSKPDIDGCDEINFSFQDMADGFVSCQADQRSSLCQDVVKEISKHPIAKLLPRGQAYQLPNSFFYWSLPTRILDSSAAKYEFRSETASWWWERHRVAVMVAIFILITLASVWLYLSIKRNNAIAVEEEIKRKERGIAEFERNRKIITEKIRDSESKKAERDRQFEIDNQKRMRAEKLAAAKKLAEEAAAQKNMEEKVREKEEVDRLLDAVFSVPANKGKNRIGRSSVAKRKQSATPHN